MTAATRRRTGPGAATTTDAFIPAAHLRFRIDDRTTFRVAWTNAVSRPDYYDLAPYSVVNRNDEEILRGNPALDATTAVNFDFLAERYLSSVGVVSVAVFRKNLDDYIYRRTFDEAVGTFRGIRGHPTC